MGDIREKAKDALNKYVHNKLNREYIFSVSADDFSNFIAKEHGYNLTIEIALGMDSLRGLVMAKNDKEVVVLLSKNNNRCWKRFTVVKEICHFFLVDNAIIKNTDTLEMSDSLMTHMAFMPNFLPKESFNKIENILAKINPLGADEAAAVIAAIEIMIPEINKDWISDRIDRGYALGQISAQLMVPNLVLEHRLKEWGLNIPLP